MKQHRFPVWRIALFVLTFSSVFWLGGVAIRGILANDLLKTGTLQFEEYLAPEAEREVFRLISFSSLVIIPSYVMALGSAIVFLSTSPFKLKEHGWLTMSAILFFLFVPVEVFTMYIDGKMIYQEFFTTSDNQMFRTLLIERLGALAGIPLIALLCYYTIIGLAIFQPLRATSPRMT